jgi:hypothetical protein
MLVNMEVTGRSAEETHAALAQYFLNCPAVVAVPASLELLPSLAVSLAVLLYC